MRAVVTGGSGFVAGWLIRHLRECGDEVVALDESVDIGDGEALRQAVVAAEPEAIYHLAAFTHVGRSWEEPREVFRVNATGTLELLLAAGACSPRPRVLVVGSSEVYGVVRPEELPVGEDTPLRPVSPYAASKVAAEYLALQHHLGHGLETIRVRAFNHIGPGQNPGFVVPALARRVAEAKARGERTVAVGNLSARRDFTDVRDVVRAYRLLVTDGEAGGVYNVCSGHDVSIDDIAGRLLRLAGADLDLVTDPGLVRPVDIPVLRGDPSRITAATGWTPTIDLDTTLADVVAGAMQTVD